MRVAVLDDTVHCGRPVHSPIALTDHLHQVAEHDEISEAIAAVLDDADEISPGDLLSLAHALSQAIERVGNRCVSRSRVRARPRTPPRH